MLHQKNISGLHLAAQIHINLIDDTGIFIDNINLCLGLELAKQINAFIQWSSADYLRVHDRLHNNSFGCLLVGEMLKSQRQKSTHHTDSKQTKKLVL